MRTYYKQFYFSATHSSSFSFLVTFCLLTFVLNSCQLPEKTNPETQNKTAGLKQTASKPNYTDSIETEIDMPDYPGRAPLSFFAPDSVEIHAVLFHQGNSLPVMVLCHQAQSSKEEYEAIASRLNLLGFNCLAIDQRSGGTALCGNNQTAENALKRNMPTDYINAEQDIITAIDYAANLYKRPVILVGSSYSASLALKIGCQNTKVTAIACFSPGEYFENQGNHFIKNSMGNACKKPLFITSSKTEAPEAATFITASAANYKTQFIPKQEGIHGARALWVSTPNNEEYWQAFETFLKDLPK